MGLNNGIDYLFVPKLLAYTLPNVFEKMLRFNRFPKANFNWLFLIFWLVYLAIVSRLMAYFAF